MTMRMRLVLGLVTLLICALVVAGCTSVNTNNQKNLNQQTMVVTSTSPTLQGTNDDQTFINAVERSGADLNPIIDKLSNAINANDYSTAGTLGFDLSAHAQFWYNKIDTMQVSSNYQDQKTSYLQALLDKKANGDDWASDASHHGAKVPSTSPPVEMTYRQTITVSTTLQSTYQQTVAVQRTYPSANDDQKFIDAYKSSGQELAPIITAINTELGSYHYSTVKTLGAKLSTRSQYWYNEIAPLSVSSKYQEGEDAYIQALPEVKAYGDALADAIQFFQDGKGSAFTSKLNEANQHLKKATIYLNLAGAELPA